MKRRFTILTAALALLTFLAVPMGMRGESIEINTTNSGVTGSYQDKEFDVNGITFKFTQWMKSTNIQAKKSTTNSLYNIDAIPGTITSIVVVQTGTARAITIYGGTSEKPTNQITSPTTNATMTFDFTGHTYNYFSLSTPSNACYFDKITVYYSAGPSITGLSYTGTPNKTQYEVGESFDPTGLTVTATYSDETTQDVTSSVVWTPNPLTAGTTSVTGTYSGLTVTVNGITVTAPAEPNIVLNKDNKPYTSTSSSNTSVETKTLDGIEYQSYAGYIYNNYLSFNRSQNGAYLGNNTPLCGNIKKIVVDYYQGGSSYFTMYEGTSALAETTTVSPSSTGTGKVTYTFSGNNGYFKFKLTTTGTYCNINSISIYLYDCSIYHVTYNANGATSGDVPSDPTEYDDDNNTVTVLGPGNLAKTGHTFSGWCLNAEGTGEIYGPETGQTATYTISANTTFYAKWTLNTHNITMPTADVYGSYNASVTSNVPYGNTVTLTYTPATGYENYVATWSVNGTTISGNTFSMPDEDVNITVSVAEIVDYAILPFTYSGGVLSDFNGLDGTSYSLDDDGSYAVSNAPYRIKFTKTGDYLQVKCNERPGKITVDVKVFSSGNDSKITVQGSADGETFTDIEELIISASTTGVKHLETTADFDATHRYVRLLFTKDGVNVGVGPISIAKYVAPTPYNLTVTLNDNVSAIYVFDANNQNDPLIADGAAGTIQVLERTSIMISPVVAEGCALTSLMVNGENVINQLDGSGAYTFTMPSQNVAISATAMVTTTYTLATTIESGRHYIITNGLNKAMGVQSTNNRPAVDVEIDIFNNVATVESADVYEFVINCIGKDEENNVLYTIYDAKYPGYLYAAGSSSNHLKTEAHLDANNNALWTISISTDDKATIKAQGQNTRNWMLYNGNSNLFSCYANKDSQQNITDEIYLYVKDNETNYTFYKDITGYTNGGGWNLIASPVNTSTTPVAAGMITDTEGADATTETATYDLYSFNQSAKNKEWVNYRQHQLDFSIESGTGYLYASKNGTTLTFTGTPYSGNGEVPLNYDSNAEFAGWNLVGNPFDCNATLDMECYTISGNAINTQAHTANNYPVAPCEGVMVKATRTNQNVIFTKASQSQVSQLKQLEMTVAQQVMSRGTATSLVHDNAIVNFNAGSQLEKFPFNADAAELYIPQDGKDYAIVSSEAQGEMPLNFKAKENGTYTLSINPEGMEMNYLHLIDNKTGNDIDLLQTPSYSFEAKTTDYESRFKLVFVANNEDSVSAGSETFAFFSNGSFVINNEGNAELQVIDIIGRIVKSESINGCANVNVNAAPGVYMLRLVNGDNVKVQKVVVK